MDYCFLLGTAQDAGVPQVGCDCGTCVAARQDVKLRRKVTALGIVLEDEGKVYLIDATPDFPSQIDDLRSKVTRPVGANPVDGIFITHLHMGHYTGLLQLGRESCHSTRLPVYASASNCEFLCSNKPFSYLVERNEIELVELEDGKARAISGIKVEPFLVAHRNEDGDTFGFRISGKNKAVTYLPDLDEWDEKAIRMVSESDVAILDGSFQKKEDIPVRPGDTSIAHPTIEETTSLFSDSGTRLLFTHFNHTNPLAAGPEGSPELFEL